MLLLQNMNKYTHGIMAQIHYTEEFHKHYQTEALTEDIAEDNYGSIESVCSLICALMGGHLIQDGKNRKVPS